MDLKLTTTERNKLILALNLAISWEDSVADANHGDNNGVMSKDAGMRKVVRDCRKNIKAFEALKIKVRG